MLKVLALCGVIVLGSARSVQAEWHFTPLVGFTGFGNTSLFDVEGGTGQRHSHLGGSVALLGSGILGAEVLSIWTPGFFERDDTLVDLTDSSRVISSMANLVITTPRRWTEYGLRPFVSGGFGLMHAQTKAIEDVFLINVNTPGYNVGGGVVGFLSDRTGVRFDVRYHSTLNRMGDEDVPAIGPVHLRYVTFSVGLVFRRDAGSR
jgi:hypothetical protein